MNHFPPPPLFPPLPPLDYTFRPRQFRGKAPMFDGRNFKFYREHLKSWMEGNFMIDWTLITDDNERNKRKPQGDPQLEYNDQKHAWNAIFTGC